MTLRPALRGSGRPLLAGPLLTTLFALVLLAARSTLALTPEEVCAGGRGSCG